MGKIDLKAAAEGVKNAGVKELEMAVKAGTVSGIAAVKQVKALEEARLQAQLHDSKAEVEAARQMVSKTERKIEYNKETMEKLRAAAKAAANPHAEAAAAEGVAKLQKINEDLISKLSNAKQDKTAAIKNAGASLKTIEGLEEKLDKAAKQAERKVVRNEKKEGEKLKKIKDAIVKAAADEGAADSAAKTMKEQAEATVAEAKDATSVLIEKRAQHKADMMKKEVAEAQRRARVAREKLQQDETKATQTKGKLVSKIETAMKMVAAIKPEQGTRTTRNDQRKVESAEKSADKAAAAELKAKQDADREKAKVARAENNVEAKAAEKAELKGEEKVLAKRMKALANATADDMSEKEKIDERAKGEQRLAEIRRSQKKVDTALAEDKGKLKTSQDKADEGEKKKEATQQLEAKAKRELERKKDSTAADKAAEAISTMKSQNVEIKENVVKVAAETQAVAKRNTEETAKDKKAVKKAEEEEKDAEEKVEATAVAPSGAMVSRLMHKLLKKAGFKAGGAL